MTNLGGTEIVIVCAIGIVVLAAIFIISAKYGSYKRTITEKTTCPHCGELNPPGNNFCGKCGQPLKG